MINIEDLPSLKNIAQTILSEGLSGQLVLFCFPNKSLWLKWKPTFLSALNNKLNERGETPFWEILEGEENSSNPLVDVVNFFGDGNKDLERLLISYGSEAPIIIELCCTTGLSEQWEKFIYDIARYFRVSESCYSNRLICIFIISPSVYPPIRLDAGIRCYGFWNPIKWEEVRLLVANHFSNQDNILSNAWQISTYTGAVNYDPELFTRLFTSTPLSLVAVKTEIQEFIKDHKIDNSAQKMLSRFYDERRWEVPQSMVNEWLAGRIIGSTLDRGNILPWTSLSNDDFNLVLYHTIWREQLTGLYPLLMEISYFTSEIVSDVMGEQWKECLPNNNQLETEPAIILDAFRSNDLGQLPVNIFRLLKKLRRVRNKLAHIEPIDLNEVESIGSLFKSISG